MFNKIKLIFFLNIFILSILFLLNPLIASANCSWETTSSCQQQNKQIDQTESSCTSMAKPSENHVCCCMYIWSNQGPTAPIAPAPVAPQGYTVHGYTDNYGGGDPNAEIVLPGVTSKRKDLNPLGQLQVKIPGIDELVEKYPIVCEDEDDKESCKVPWIAIYIYAIYNYILAIGGILAVFTLMIGGILWLVSAGNASRISEAKSWISGSITGVIILLTSYTLLYHINPEMLGLRYIKMESIERMSLEAESTPPLDLSSLSGKIYPESEWISIDSHSNIINNTGSLVNPLIAESILKAADCMKIANYKIRISSLARTVSRQKELYSQNYSHAHNQCGARKSEEHTIVCCPFPSESKLCPHTSGNAVDAWGVDLSSSAANKISTASQHKLQECMFSAGFCIIPSECWHFELPALSGSCHQQKNLAGSWCKDLRDGKY